MFCNSHSRSGTSLDAYLDGLFANLSKRFEIDVTDSQKQLSHRRSYSFERAALLRHSMS